MWITAEDVGLVDRSGAEATSYVMYPTESGELDWELYGVQDESETWSVDIDLDGDLSSTAYILGELQLSGQETVSVGTDLTGYSGSGSTLYYSDLVPTALVADLQVHLGAAALLLEQRADTRSGRIPDVYLLGNRELMEEVGAATGVTLGFEDGYYKSFGARPGIYMRTDLQTTVVRRLLVHEYAHLVFEDLANRRQLPAWLAEGLSRFYEFDIALSGPRPDATKLRHFRAADEARAAARAGSLFSLNSLNSQSDWNKRTDPDQISLQYAEAYMAVRYLNETYGPLAAKDVVVEFGRGFGLPGSIKIVTGLDLAEFESRFIGWLVGWKDPARAPISDYISALETLMAEQDAILDHRSEDRNTSRTASEAAINRASLANSTQAVILGLQGLLPPQGTLALHQEAQGYLDRVFVWLTLEFQYADTLDNAKRSAANAMIPEINARKFLLQRSMSNLQFILHLRG